MPHARPARSGLSHSRMGPRLPRLAAGPVLAVPAPMTGALTAPALQAAYRVCLVSVGLATLLLAGRVIALL